MLRNFVGVGFHSFPGEGAASWEAALKIVHEKHEKKTKKICVICVICGSFFFIVFERYSYHDELLKELTNGKKN